MNQNLPPKWIMKFFRWFCNEHLCDAIEGDLLTLYEEKRQTQSLFRANLWFIFSVFTFLQPFALKTNNVYRQNSTVMVFNNLKIGIRFIRKQIVYTAINVTGLAVGLSAFMLMSLFIVHELSYDRFHDNSENIIRLNFTKQTASSTSTGARIPFPIKKVLESDYPEIEKVARFYYWSGNIPVLTYQGQKFTEKKLYFGDPEVLDVFDFELILGNPKTALSDPRSIVLTQKMASKYFGSDNPINQVIRYKDQDDLIVTGVLEDIPDNSHITFDFLVPLELQRQQWLGWEEADGYDLEQDWGTNFGAWVYLALQPGTNIDDFENKLQVIANEYLTSQERGDFTLQTQPLTDIHLKSNLPDEPGVNGNEMQVYGFGIIAILILLVATINFVNLTAVQMNKRVKEVGVRKVLGAERRQLVSQFITESLLIVSIAVIIGLLLANISLPYFNRFSGKSLEISLDYIPFLMALIILIFALAILAGISPFLSINRIDPVQGLADKLKSGRTRKRFSKGLVVGQFAICNLLIIGVLVINNQLQYLLNKDLGFDKEQIIIIEHSRNLSVRQYDVFRNQLASSPNIKNVNRGYVAGTTATNESFKVKNSSDPMLRNLGLKWMGEGFLEMFGLELLTGESLKDENTEENQSHVYINASASKAFGWSLEESIGKQITRVRGGNKSSEDFTVVGVLADAHLESLHHVVEPSVFIKPRLSVGAEITIKLGNTGNLNVTLESIEKAWKNTSEQYPFGFSFLDEQIESQYHKEKRLGTSIKYFAILAIFIACLGLFGLASFTVQEKTKEIGVRKVLGASMLSIVSMVSRIFLGLMLIAFVIAIPLAVYLSDLWLQDFAYQTNISVQIFLLAGLVSLVIVIIAVGGQSLKAANGDPVKTLRYE